MYKQGVLLSKQVAISVAVACLLLLIFAWIVALPFQALSMFAGMLLCAATPLSLPLVILLQRIFHKDTAHHLPSTKKAVLAYFTFAIAQAATVLLSVVLFSAHGLPPVLSVAQILALTFVILLPPLVVLSRGQTHDHNNNTTIQFLDTAGVRTMLWHGLLIAGLAGMNYYWFFERNYLSTTPVMASSPDHLQAGTVTFATLALCFLVKVLQIRSHNRSKITSRSSLHSQNRYIRGAFGLSLFCIVTIIYNPWVAPYFGTVPLGWVDLGYTMGAVMLYALLTEFHHHNKKHSRKAVLALHREKRAKA